MCIFSNEVKFVSVNIKLGITLLCVNVALSLRLPVAILNFALH